jgi:hypothetical protein
LLFAWACLQEMLPRGVAVTYVLPWCALLIRWYARRSWLSVCLGQ